MRKLDLPSEDEVSDHIFYSLYVTRAFILKIKCFFFFALQVEIRCRGEPVIPTLQLYKLIELWLQTVSTSEKISATIGSSAEEFVMVLGYARKPASA